MYLEGFNEAPRKFGLKLLRMPYAHIFDLDGTLYFHPMLSTGDAAFWTMYACGSLNCIIHKMPNERQIKMDSKRFKLADFFWVLANEK